jgi:hypothetical protein
VAVVINCMLQVIQFMAEQARMPTVTYSFHHCAAVNMTADTTRYVIELLVCARKRCAPPEVRLG